ncbi:MULTISPECIES: Zn-dependent hydrolase [unclassified Pseudomonas]|uniref:Zn-dependent hydrolase n=1 Tax=unclassified Pseudomonas TaxID=196821 RepID=UPI00131A63CE|nr:MULTISPECIES: Zn-dependent hydrolase [unclassified Pseudomonas]
MRKQLPEPDWAQADALFLTLHALSFDGVGITRDSYGSGEQRAHDLLREQALQAGLEVSVDAALNLYMTLPGRVRRTQVVMTGSHLDSVPRGGNYDGAAGVVAGLAVLSGWAKAGYQPEHDVTVMAVRAEESAWFPVSYVGSKGAFGLLPAEALQARRADNGQTLSEHLLRLGGAPEQIASQVAALNPRNIDSFIEVHIEQGPVLIEADIALGIVSGICGSLRYRKARALGGYAHSGATPRSHRRDAVVAVSQLVMALQHLWERMEQEGHQLTVTVGQFATDPVQADFSKVSGQVDFCIDLRSEKTSTLALMEQNLQATIAQIGTQHGVTFDLGERTQSTPGVMSPQLVAELDRAARQWGVKTRSMPSGAGHDAAVFAGQGVDTAMVFIRNANGSHNPDEAMSREDFCDATRLLATVLANRAG